MRPGQLLSHLQAIERHYARQAKRRDGPRPLAIDMLAAGQCTNSEPRVLLPLRDLAPDFRLAPSAQRVRDLVAALSPVERNRAQRIPQTAYLHAPPRLDYDAPDGAAAHYDEIRPLSRFNKLAFERMRGTMELSPGQRVLDVGCGTGRFSLLLAQAGADVTGVDRSETMLASARANAIPNAGSVRYLKGDANAALPKGTFDAITFFFSIHYMALDPRFWDRLHTALRPGGVVAFLTFPHRHFIETTLTRFFPGIARIDLARFPSEPALIDDLETHGFQHIASNAVIHKGTTSTAEWIARVERKYLSTFHLLSAREYTAGLHAMKAALRGKRRCRSMIDAVIVSGRRPVTPI